jgi:hypothetical protein
MKIGMGWLELAAFFLSMAVTLAVGLPGKRPAGEAIERIGREQGGGIYECSGVERPGVEAVTRAEDDKTEDRVVVRPQAGEGALIGV